MSNLFCRRFVTGILALLIVGSMSHTLSQTQSKTISDENEAEIPRVIDPTRDQTLGRGVWGGQVFLFREHKFAFGFANNETRFLVDISRQYPVADT